MSDSDKIVVNLYTGHEDADKVTIALLVATAVQAKGKPAVMFLTKEAVRLGLPGYADAVESASAPPVSLYRQFADAGGDRYICPFCFEHARVAARGAFGVVRDRGGRRAGSG